MVKQQKEEVDLSASLAEVWRVLTEKERDVLRNNSTIQHFKRNELIYCEGDEPRDMMCLLKGKVKIFKEGVGGRTVNLTQKHIRGRLAESLLFLKDSYGLEEDGATLSIYLSREDLANLSNMTTSNAIRTLSTFVAERIIAIDGRKIKLIDEDKLKKISKMG